MHTRVALAKVGQKLGRLAALVVGEVNEACRQRRQVVSTLDCILREEESVLHSF